MKRTLTLLMAFAMIATMVAGCETPAPTATSGTLAPPTQGTEKPGDPEAQIDPFGAYEDTLDISIVQKIETVWTYPEGQDATNNQYTQYLKDTLNVNITFDWVAQSGEPFEQKLSLAISSASLPDIVIAPRASFFRAMAKDGLLQDLEQTIADYASPTMQKILGSTNGLALDYASYDGKVLALPNVSPGDDDYHNLWIRQDWLDNLGLSAPKTIDDLEAVLDAFVNKDPDGNGKADTIGLGGQDKNLDPGLYTNFIFPSSNHFGLDAVFQAYKAYPGFWVKDAGGNVTYGSLQPETKEALAKLADWYQKGLIDKEIGVRENKVETITNGTCGIFSGVWWAGYWPLPDAQKADPAASWVAYPGPFASDGQWYPGVGNPIREFGCVNKNFSNPEALIKINNLLLRDEQTFDIEAVEIGVFPLRLVYAPLDESTYSAQAILDYLNGTKNLDQINTLGYKLLDNDLKTARDIKLEPFDSFNIQYWNKDHENFNRLFSLLVGTAPQMNTPYNAVSSLTYSHTESSEKYWASLWAKEQSVFLGIITGSRPIDDFDKFVAEWKAEGGDIIIAEVAASIQ